MKLRFKKLIFFVLVSGYAACFFISDAFAGKLSQIRLDDGSSIQAKVISFSGGIYVLNSPSLGTFEMSEEKIISIQMSGKKTSQGNPESISNLDVDVSQFRNQLSQDPETMQMIQDLQNDPSVKEILNDDALMKAINGQDLGVFVQDPKIKSFANSEAFRAILEKSR
jgi:hypothetical protein